MSVSLSSRRFGGFSSFFSIALGAAMALTAALGLGATSASADGERTTWRITNYPSSGSCHELVRTIATRFDAATGVRPLSARCTNIDTVTFDMEVVFETTNANIKLQSTSVRRDLIVNAAQYASAEVCNAALPAVTAKFRSKTGLEPLVSYCYAEESTDRNPWVARVDGFGNPDYKPYFSGGLLLEYPHSMTLADLRATLMTSLATRGIDVQYVTIRSQGPMEGHITVMYYAREKFQLENIQHARLTSAANCGVALEQAIDALASSDNAPLTTFCASSFIGGTYYIMSMYMNDPTLDQVASAEKFATWDECAAKHESIIATYRDQLGYKVTGGFCSLPEDSFMNGNEFRVQLMVEP